MMDLRNIILEKKDHLPKQTGKLVNRLYNKIKLDSYYPDNKNVIKLKEFSTVEINNFLLVFRISKQPKITRNIQA